MFTGGKKKNFKQDQNFRQATDAGSSPAFFSPSSSTYANGHFFKHPVPLSSLLGTEHHIQSGDSWDP